MKVIDKKELLRWLESLGREHLLIAPQDAGGGAVLFAPVSNIEKILLDCANTTLSPKGWFFPPSEALFTVQRRNGSTEITPAREERNAIIFGIRPCDALGLKIIDKPFLEEPEDPLYAQRRARTALIGLACSQECPQGFCGSMGSGPHDSSNVDILLNEIKEGYAAQPITERGKQLLSLAKGEEKDVSLPAVSSSQAKVPTEHIAERARQLFNSPYWERVADRCIHCNICAYVCPVCYCFDIGDYKSRGHIERIRCWESCQSKGFTQIAGGYERRADKGMRMRQRFCHKLLYFPEEFGPLKCTGCGRCVVSCPVNIDIREIISDLQKMGGKGNA